jgi:hypothetical protein
MLYNPNGPFKITICLRLDMFVYFSSTTVSFIYYKSENDTTLFSFYLASRKFSLF